MPCNRDDARQAVTAPAAGTAAASREPAEATTLAAAAAAAGTAGATLAAARPEPQPPRTLPVRDLLLLVGDAERGRKPQALQILTENGFDALYPVLEAAVRDNDNADLRNGAMETLVAFGEASVPRLCGLLADGDEEIRNFSAVMLGDIGSRTAAPALVEALRDPDANVAHAAAEALGKIGDRGALAPLVELLQGDLWLQFPAVTALGLLRDHRALPHLLPLLDHELLILPAVEALAQIGHPRALQPLAQLLDGADDHLVATCARAIVAIQRNANDLLNFKNDLVELGHPEGLEGLVTQKGVQNLAAIVRRAADPDSVQAAVALLAWAGHVDALEDFLALLADEQYLVAVESAILSLGAPAEKPLLAALQHGNPRVRALALRSLRWLGVPCSREDLARLLADADPPVQLEALETLKEYRQPALLPLIFRLVEEGSDETALMACETLGKYPFSAVRHFFRSLARSEEPSLRRRCALLCGHLKGSAGCSAIEALSADGDAAVRRESARAIGVRKLRPAIPLLRQALSDPDKLVRETAVLSAAAFGEPVLLEEILALLGSGSEALDYAVIRAMGIMGAHDAGASILAYLNQGAVSRQLAYSLIETLGKTGYRSAAALVRREYLKHPDADFRRLAVETLGNLGDADAVADVAGAVADPHWSVRIAALHALGKIGGERSVPLLLESLQDPDPMVRGHGIATLGELRAPATIPRLAQELAEIETGRQAFEALLKFGRAALPALHKLAEAGDTAELRERVIDLIGKIGSPRSVDPLLELLHDGDAAIRLAAIDALSHCYNSVPLKRLLQVREGDPSVEVQARAALALRALTAESYR